MTPSDYIPCENCRNHGTNPPNNATHLFLSPVNYNSKVQAEKHWSSNLDMYTYRICNDCIHADNIRGISRERSIDRQDYLAAMAMAAL